jgi:hypothetical protein
MGGNVPEEPFDAITEGCFHVVSDTVVLGGTTFGLVVQADKVASANERKFEEDAGPDGFPSASCRLRAGSDGRAEKEGVLPDDVFDGISCVSTGTRLAFDQFEELPGDDLAGTLDG